MALVLPAWSDGLAVPVAGKIAIVDLDQVRVTRSVELRGRGTPVLAGHPTAPILASLMDSGGLIFWNLPAFTEASQFRDPLFDDVVAMQFAPAGDRLYLLHPALKAVLVFSLQSSKVESVYPVPGGAPVDLRLVADGLLVQQQDGLVILEPASGALLGQWRLGGQVTGALLEGPALTLAVQGRSGLQRFDAQTAARMAPPPGDGVYGELRRLNTGELLAVGLSAQTLELRGADGKLKWTVPLSPGPHSLAIRADGRWVYALGHQSGTVSVVELATGRELGKLPVDGLRGPGVLFQDGGL